MYPILEDKSNNPFPDLPPISYTDVYRQFKYSNIPDFMITDELKMNVPNGKTRIVIEGIKRVELKSVIEEDKYFINFSWF